MHASNATHRCRCVISADLCGFHWWLQLWDRWSRPYIERIVRKVKAEHPGVPITLYANGSGGLLERLGSTGADVVGLDWTSDMSDARRRLGPDVAVQVMQQSCRNCWAQSFLLHQQSGHD